MGVEVVVLPSLYWFLVRTLGHEVVEWNLKLASCRKSQGKFEQLSIDFCKII